MMTKLEKNKSDESPDLPDCQTPAVDPTVLDSIRVLEDDNDPNLLNDMIRLYLGSSDEALTILRTSDITDNPDNLRKVAHSLKGSSASIGASRLAACCLVIEKLCHQNQLNRFSIILNQLEKEYQAVQACLLKEMQGKAA